MKITYNTLKVKRMILLEQEKSPSATFHPLALFIVMKNPINSC